MEHTFSPTCRLGNKFHVGKYYSHFLFYEDVQDIITHTFRIANQAGLEGHKLSEPKIFKVNETDGFILECDCEE